MSYILLTDSRILYVIAGILTSASAQIFMKIATRFEVLHFTWSIFIVCSILSYFISFSMYYLALKHFPLSKISPLMTIGVVILVVLYGIFAGETISSRQVLGIFLGILSIFFLLS